MSYTTLELFRFTINKLITIAITCQLVNGHSSDNRYDSEVYDTLVSYFAFFAQAVSLYYLWNMAVIVAWTIGLVLEVFRGDSCCSRRILLPNNSALPAIFITLTELYEERRRVTHTTGYLITVTMFQLSMFRVYLLPRRYSSPSGSTKLSSEFES